MGKEIKKVAVLGAGVMGAAIAAHMANAGLPCTLLDIVPKEPDETEKKRGLTLEHPAVRNRFANSGLQAALNARPAAFFSKKEADLVTTGNFEDNMDRIGDCDLILEAVIENLKIKQGLFQKVAKFRKPGSIVASNTSGISVVAMAEGLPEEFQEHFCVTHFFNPPRYMKLLEIVAHPKTSKEVLETIERFCTYRLGKGVIHAKDTPNFVANRIGVEAMMYAMNLMAEEGYRIDEVDAITGPPLGRPKTASFKTADLVGLDTLAHVAENVYENTPHDERRETFRLPDFVQQMVQRKWLGNKTQQGFYKKEKSPDGKTLRKVLDPSTMEYVDTEKFKDGSLKAAKGIEDVGERIRSMVYADDRAGRFAWKVTAESALYAARRIPEICDTVVDADHAIKWGFNYELGPFEAWDAIGVRKSVERMQAEGMDVPRNVLDMLAAGKESFYIKKEDGPYYYDFAKRDHVKLTRNPDIILLPERKERNKIVASNAGATLVDLDDGVVCLEFHSKMNSVDQDIIAMLSKSVDIVAENFEGLVIANHATNFSVGANIFLILAFAQENKFAEIEKVVKDFQDANMRLRYSPRPVVVATAGMALGGGCEIAMHADRLQACGETYMGLVEVGVGLIPAGGGCKEMVKRMVEGIPGDPPDNLLPFVQKAFQPIATAKVTRSAVEAFALGMLKPTDGITMNRDLLILDAKQAVLGMAMAGYREPRPMKDIAVGGEEAASALRVYVQGMRNAGYVTEYDQVVGSKLAHALTGGEVPMGARVSEQHLLDLEREAFLSLCGDKRTQDRMAHMLTYNRPLRN